MMITSLMLASLNEPSKHLDKRRVIFLLGRSRVLEASLKKSFLKISISRCILEPSEMTMVHQEIFKVFKHFQQFSRSFQARNFQSKDRGNPVGLQY